VLDAGLVVGGTAGYLSGSLPAWATVAAHSLAFYLGFTVLHESVHRLVHRNRFLNDVLDWPTALVFTVTQTTFRAVHLMHHSQTNDPDQDPDFFVGQGPWWQRPYDSRERFLDTRAYGGRVLNVVLLGQNYHLVHHAWNTIAWFRYQRAFDAARAELEAIGARLGAGDHRRPLPAG
jgi:fatty acid desaturase